MTTVRPVASTTWSPTTARIPSRSRRSGAPGSRSTRFPGPSERTRPARSRRKLPAAARSGTSPSVRGPHRSRPPPRPRLPARPHPCPPEHGRCGQRPIAGVDDGSRHRAEGRTRDQIGALDGLDGRTRVLPEQPRRFHVLGDVLGRAHWSVPPAGLEPATDGLEGRCSTQSFVLVRGICNPFSLASVRHK